MRDIRSYHLGHGLIVVDANDDDSRTGDYRELAFIYPSREIDWRSGVILTKADRKAIKHIAATDDRSVSVTQDYLKVFNERPKT